jgi:hypothetical protein
VRPGIYPIETGLEQPTKYVLNILMGYSDICGAYVLCNVLQRHVGLELSACVTQKAAKMDKIDHLKVEWN